MLIAARNFQDFACCLRATASARSKYASAFAASGADDIMAISPAMRLASASNHLSLVASIVLVASSTQRQASSSSPRSVCAIAKCDNDHGFPNVNPIGRNAVIPAVIIWTAFEASPLSANRQPWFSDPLTFQNGTSFSSASAQSSCASARCPRHYSRAPKKVFE